MKKAEGRWVRLTLLNNHEDAQYTELMVFVFSPDGGSFRGYWWRGTDKGREPDGNWTGTRAGTEVGGCSHWSGSVEGQLKKDLSASGRARLYGILFDTDSAHIRPESLPTLAEVVGKGVAPSRLSSLGFGQSKPVADNATELGRAQNRRVELVRK
jgi:hypothetical protein